MLIAQRDGLRGTFRLLREHEMQQIVCCEPSAFIPFRDDLIAFRRIEKIDGSNRLIRRVGDLLQKASILVGHARHTPLIKQVTVVHPIELCLLLALKSM